jgi:drug/metabolite transporter (DMT)-like permease
MRFPVHLLRMCAFVTVVLVWSTTPLSIRWSNLTYGPELSGGLRMGIASVLAYALLRLNRLHFRTDKQALQAYGAAWLGIFLSMYCVYLATQRVPTGLISVCYGLAPMLSALLSQLAEQPRAQRLNRWQWVGLWCALTGLCLIFYTPQHAPHTKISLSGVLLALLAVFLFSASVVAGKRFQQQIHPLQTLAGTLPLSALCFGVVWTATGNTPPHWDHPAWWLSTQALFYLAVFGSVIGFAAFFYLVKHSSSVTSSLPTVVTPVLALVLGAWLNHEVLPPMTWVGVSGILAGLSLFVWVGRR